MHLALRQRDRRSRSLVLAAVLLLLAGVSAKLARTAFDVLAVGLTLCAAILVGLALRRPGDGR